MFPSFIIIGAMKSGTTSLYRYLGAHPEVWVPRIKETDFFVQEKNYQRGFEWYASLFRDNHSCLTCGEASPNYSKQHLFAGVPARIHSLLPKARLIYVIRDPIQRALSHYLHNIVNGRETRSLHDAFAIVDANNYLLTSCYHYQLTAFREYFPAENILVLISERLYTDRRATLRKVFDFLGVSNDFDSKLFYQTHHTSSRKLKRSRLVRYIPGRQLRHLFHVVVSMFNSAPSDTERPTLDDATLASLREYFREDLAQLRALTGEQYTEWSLTKGR